MHASATEHFVGRKRALVIQICIIYMWANAAVTRMDNSLTVCALLATLTRPVLPAKAPASPEEAAKTAEEAMARGEVGQKREGGVELGRKGADLMAFGSLVYANDMECGGSSLLYSQL
jgi:hypothetical protein